ncbi:MAG: FHA domain-containing protein [Eubacteriales bacterium]
MNLVKCNNGHFYDGDRFGTCPHCNASAMNDNNLTVPIQRNDEGDAVTVALSQSVESVPQVLESQPVPETSSLQDAVNAAVQGQVNAPVVEDDNKTVGFFSSVMGKEPVVGWLVCTEGEHFGEDFRLKSGRNFVGRGANMDVSITKDQTVSRERHAIIVYEPRGNVFLIQPGDSKELCYLNDEVVLSPQMIHGHDRVLVGQTELMFIPCCTAQFNWEKTKQEQ